LSAHERVIAAVGIAGPTLRFRGKELAQKVSLVTEIAARLAMGLGRLEGGPTLVAFDKSRETNGPKASGEV
jgi:hypothetical protein